jgi:hypothetical protein
MGKQAVLPQLPDPEPSSVPGPLRRGAKWELHPESGQIVSSYYGRRYSLHTDSLTRQKLQRMRREDASAAETRNQEDEEAEESGASNGT